MAWTDSAHDIANPNELPAELSDSIETPFDAFWNIYNDGLLDIITTQTNIYATQHKGLNPPATSEKIKVVISILLLSGYCMVPCQDLYWSASSDNYKESVSKVISRNVFERTLVMFTFKITPILMMIIITKSDTHLTFWIQISNVCICENFSVDESIIPYYGKHSTK